MSICQLIHKEIQKISGLEIDFQNLNSREYDELMEKIPKEIDKLIALTKILNLKPEDLTKIDIFLISKNLYFTTNLFDILATSENEICDTSVIYVGNLNYKKYEQTAEGITKLPDKLKYIFGSFEASNSNIESVELDYLSGISGVYYCQKLQKIHIKKNRGSIHIEGCDKLSKLIIEAGTGFSLVDLINIIEIDTGDISVFDISGCSKLTNVKIGNAHHAEFSDNQMLEKLEISSVRYVLKISSSPNLTLDNIRSKVAGNMIKIGHELALVDTPLANLLTEQILEKFDIDPVKIIRN